MVGFDRFSSFLEMEQKLDTLIQVFIKKKHVHLTRLRIINNLRSPNPVFISFKENSKQFRWRTLHFLFDEEINLLLFPNAAQKYEFALKTNQSGLELGQTVLVTAFSVVRYCKASFLTKNMAIYKSKAQILDYINNIKL